MTQTTLSLAQQWLDEADGILVTASNGFSIAENFNLFKNDAQLRTVLGDLVDEFHLTSFIDAFQHPYPTTKDYWRVIARIVDYYGYHYQPSAMMQQLQTLLNGHDAFIWTSNTEHHFHLAGITNVFENEGNFLTGVCENHRYDHPKVDLTTPLHNLALLDQAGGLTTDQLPTCNVCGAPLVLDIISDNFEFDSDQVTQLREFIDQHERLVILELGIGPRNQLIK